MNGPVRVSFVVVILSILVFSAAPARAERCRPCEVVQQRCSANCFGLDRGEVGKCLMACDNQAAICSCDEAVTLNSEDFVGRFGSPAVTEFAEACHSTAACGPEYGSCAGWSTYLECGNPRCAFHVQGCGGGGYEDPPFGPGTVQNLERYRVCFNSLGEPCTEYQRTLWTVGCGC